MTPWLCIVLFHRQSPLVSGPVPILGSGSRGFKCLLKVEDPNRLLRAVTGCASMATGELGAGCSWDPQGSSKGVGKRTGSRRTKKGSSKGSCPLPQAAGALSHGKLRHSRGVSALPLQCQESWALIRLPALLQAEHGDCVALGLGTDTMQWSAGGAS
jgi:hypothetical protein